MIEIRMTTGTYFWTSSYPIALMSERPPRMLQLKTAADVDSASTHRALRDKARGRLAAGKVHDTFLNPKEVAQIVDLG